MESCLFKETNCQPEARKEFGAKMQINEQTLHLIGEHYHKNYKNNWNIFLNITEVLCSNHLDISSHL